MTVALLIHAHPSMRARYAAALGVDVHPVNSTGSQLSAGYDERTGIAAHHGTVAKLLARYAPDAPKDSEVVLVAFSAGCWLARAVLRDTESRIRTRAAVFLDGLHAGSSSPLGGVLDFARMAIERPGERRCVITHSQIVPPYAPTRDTASLILSALQRPRVSFDESVTHGGLSVHAYPGAAAAAHARQLQTIGPAVCSERVRPVLVSRADTIPAPPPSSGPLPLSRRALAVALAEAQRWGSKRPPTDRVAEYFGGCERDGVVICGWLAEQVRAGVAHSHCAAALGWCEAQAAEPGDVLPPWRAGAREIERDAKAGRRGRWVPREAALAGYRPPPGAVVVYWRQSERSGLGHVERVVEATAEGYRSIGANEAAGAWYLDTKPQPYAHAQLLGFVVDDEQPDRVSDPPSSPAPAEVEPPITVGEWERLRPNLIPLEVDWDQFERDRRAAVRDADD